MHVEDLHHDGILDLDPESGLIRFAGHVACHLLGRTRVTITPKS